MRLLEPLAVFRGGSAASLTRPAFPRVARGAPEAERGLGGAAAGQRRGSGGTAPLKTPPLASLACDVPVTAVTVSGEMVSGTPGRGRGSGAGRGQREGHTGISARCPVARLGSGRTELCAACPCSRPHPPRARSGSSPAGFWHGVFLLRLLSYPHLTLYARLWW